MTLMLLSEIKRLTPPFLSEADELEAEKYWAQRPSEDREQAMRQVMREFYRLQGVDIDKPMDKTIRRITLEEKNRQHEEWHRAFNSFHASR